MQAKSMVSNNGAVFWSPPARLRSTCKIDITYFPFDDQSCKMKFGSWTYDSYQVNISKRREHVDLSNYVANGEWDLIHINVDRNQIFYPCCETPFPDLTFTIKIRRRTLYYLFNIIFPCLWLTILSLLDFWLPPDSGEKITLGITVLLAFSVFMLLIAENMPETSDFVPLIGIYLTVTMATTSLSIILTVVVLNLHHIRPNHKSLNPRVKYFFFNVVAPFLRMKCIANYQQSLRKKAGQQRVQKIRDWLFINDNGTGQDDGGGEANNSKMPTKNALFSDYPNSCFPNNTKKINEVNTVNDVCAVPKLANRFLAVPLLAEVAFDSASLSGVIQSRKKSRLYQKVFTSSSSANTTSMPYNNSHTSNTALPGATPASRITGWKWKLGKSRRPHPCPHSHHHSHPNRTHLHQIQHELFASTFLENGGKPVENEGDSLSTSCGCRIGIVPCRQVDYRRHLIQNTNDNKTQNSNINTSGGRGIKANESGQVSPILSPCFNFVAQESRLSNEDATSSLNSIDHDGDDTDEKANSKKLVSVPSVFSLHRDSSAPTKSPPKNRPIRPQKFSPATIKTRTTVTTSLGTQTVEQLQQKQQQDELKLIGERARFQYNLVSDYIFQLIVKQEQEEQLQETIKEWKLLAYIIDRCLFWIFLFVSVFSTTLTLLIMPLFKPLLVTPSESSEFLSSTPPPTS